MPPEPPDLDWTGDVDPHDGPAPPEIQTVTGETTWPGVYRCMQRHDERGIIHTKGDGDTSVELRPERSPPDQPRAQP